MGRGGWIRGALALGLCLWGCDDGDPDPACQADTDCRRGTRCLSSGQCDDLCDPSLCVAPFACVTETLCGPMPCQGDGDCQADEFCHEGGCYDQGGRCETAADCPSYGTLLSPACQERHCRLQGDDDTSAAAAVPGFTREQTTLAVSVRFEGCTGPAPCLRWMDPKGPRPLALVVMDPLADPRTGEGLASTQWSLWPDPAAGEAAFSEGAWITDGVPTPWSAEDPRAASTDTVYALALAYAPGEIVAVSSAVLFNFAQAWSQVGSECSDAQPCVSPGDPLACREGTCQRPCASALDCDGRERCGGLLSTGVRFCEERL
ncbi:MAG: hypothetical protein KC613_12745 [Myxococcales bacterium]|nr:hypothetical protein [Myxococcales bacterium]